MNNPIRGRFNAWLLDWLDAYMDRKYAGVKTRLFASAPRTVVEIGSGAGANLRYWPRGAKMIAVEPNVRMHARLRRNAERRGIERDLRSVRGEEIDIETGSVEFVFATLVLCSVADPGIVLREVRRILRAGGHFVCIEHIAAPPSSLVRGFQAVIRRPWHWAFEGCNLLNDTPRLLREAGFRDVKIEPLRIATAFVPIRYQIAAVCTA